jgi:2'-5' RNA ligase
MSKRLFVALPIEQDLTRVLANYISQYGELPWLKLETSEHLHTTVLFLGEVKDELIPEIEDALTDIAAIQQAFTLEIEKIAYAPEAQRASMIWARFKENKQFTLLLSRVKEELYYILGDTDEKPTIAHITLARFNKKVPPPKDLPDFMQIERGVGIMAVTKMTLMESKLPTAHKSESGPTYNVIREFSFKA